AAEIDPVDRIASNSAILPGPIRSPLVKSRRMLRRVLAMALARLQGSRPEHREGAAFVKGCVRAAPPLASAVRPPCPFQETMLWGKADISHPTQRSAAPTIGRRAADGNVAHNTYRRSGSIEMLTIPDDELRRWLAEDVPYGDLTTHALGFGDRPGRVRFEARQAMVAACSEEAGRIMNMA